MLAPDQKEHSQQVASSTAPPIPTTATATDQPAEKQQRRVSLQNRVLLGEKATPMGMGVAPPPKRKQTAANIQELLKAPIVKVHTGTLLRRDQGEQHNRRGLENRLLCNNPVQAIADFSRAILLVPEEPSYYWHRAECYLAVMDFDSCLTDFRQHILMVSELRAKLVVKPRESIYVTRFRMSRIVFLWGQCLLDQYRYREALDQFLLASQLQFHLPSVTLRMTATKIAHGMIDDALEGIYALIQATPPDTPPDVDLIILRGKLYKLLNNADFVHLSVQQAQEIEPEHPDLAELRQFVLSVAVKLKNYAWEKEQSGQLAVAITFLNHAIQLDPDDVNLFIRRGSLFMELDNYDTALEDLEGILPVISHDETKLKKVKACISQIHERLGQQVHETNQIDEAIHHFSVALQFNPSQVLIFKQRADCYLQKGLHDLALQDLQILLKTHPQDEYGQVQAGTLLAKKGIQAMTDGHYDKAIDYLNQAISYNSLHPEYYYHRGRCHYYMNKIQEAKDDLSASLDHNPNHQAAKSLLASLMPVPPMPDIAPLQARKTRTKQDVLTMSALEIQSSRFQKASGLVIEKGVTRLVGDSLPPVPTSIPTDTESRVKEMTSLDSLDGSSPNEMSQATQAIKAVTKRPVIHRVNNPVLHEQNLSLDLSKLPSLFK